LFLVDFERAPLYPGPNAFQTTQLPSALLLPNDHSTLRKRMSQDYDRPALLHRQKTKLRIVKENTRVYLYQSKNNELFFSFFYGLSLFSSKKKYQQ
jgi:hypothetical protein